MEIGKGGPARANASVMLPMTLRFLIAMIASVELTRFGGRFRYAAFFTDCISSNSIGLW
jgi:hypothetical protein